MSYQDRIEALFARTPSFQVVGGRAYKPGIETMIAFDNALGHPHRSFKIIHVAGTNGKGSVSSMIAAALAGAGHKVGLYTSPHLLDFRERMKIVDREGFRLIPKESVLEFLDKWDGFIEKEAPSFFEITTAMAFSFFAEENVDFAVIETGLGGRLDSTNVVDPVLSVITNIGLEHCAYLGDTLDKIAWEKAGIIKPNRPVVVGETLPQILPVFQRKAYETASDLYLAENYSGNLRISAMELDLKGIYQKSNLKTTLCALDVLGVVIDDKVIASIRNAASVTGLRGRWQKVDAPQSKATIICDIGHNAHGLAHVFHQLQGELQYYGKIFIIFGVVSDKDMDAVVPLMLPPSDKVSYIFTQASTQRALSAENLLTKAKEYGIEGSLAPSVSQAIDIAMNLAGEEDLIFIGGSNFTVADALEHLEAV